MNSVFSPFAAKKVIFLLLFLFSSPLFAADYCDQTQLYRYMDDIKVELKSFALEVKKQKYSIAKGRIQKIIKLLEKSKDETPFLFSERQIEGQELEQKLSQYQRSLSDTIAIFNKLDLALQNESANEIKKLMGEVGKARKLGHRHFKSKC